MHIHKHEADILELGIKITNENFQIDFFDKKVSFTFSIVRMPGKPSNYYIK